MRARGGGGAAAWVAGVLAAPGPQGGWRLGQQEMQCSRRVWQPVLADRLQNSCLENPLPDREAWQAAVYRVAKSWTRPKRPCMDRRVTFSAHGSSAPVRVDHEGDAAAWLAGTLVLPSMHGHRLPGQQEL